MAVESTPLVAGPGEQVKDDTTPSAMKRGASQYGFHLADSSDVGLFDYNPEPAMFRPGASEQTPRRRRCKKRTAYHPFNGTVLGAFHALCLGDVRKRTVFASSRLLVVLSLHLSLATVLAVGYYFFPLATTTPDDEPTTVGADFLNGIKDYVDLCVTGIVFLLGGFVTIMLTRWWNFRTTCCGALHQALVNLCLYSATLWSTASPVHREARALLSRYAVAAYTLLFVEARAGDYPNEAHETLDAAVASLVLKGILLPEEHTAIRVLPNKASILVGWIGSIFERVLDKDSPLACAEGIYRNADNGRYSVIFTQVFNARNAIALCHMHMQTQLPYAYVHIIIILVHITCFANSIYCGIHLGHVIGLAIAADEAAQVLIPLIAVRAFRICFIPLLLDGMIIIGTIIALPMGDDMDDFPAGAFIEGLEEETLADGAALEAFHPASKLLTKKGEAPKDM